MSDPVIAVETISKRYIISHKLNSNDGLRHRLENIMRRPISWFREMRVISSKKKEEFWALRDLSFCVKQGEVLGIIGRNGAGKSTLLKILSRITAPTKGRISLNGRVASLLEVGTGFHPDLTGRENIFLNGAILGMNRREIRSKFDEIVAFADVEKFLDTPVKRYSSGMYVRLAFAVAAHLEPEILVIDEVLAVGDAAFQTRCLRRMGEVAQGGRTVLFVSHNMSAIDRLCSRVLLLDKGGAAFDGGCKEGLTAYLSNGLTTGHDWQRNPPYPKKPHLRSVQLCQSDGTLCQTPTSASELGVIVRFAITERCGPMILSVAVFDENGRPLFASSPHDCDINLPTNAGVYKMMVLFPSGLFMPKIFSVSAAIYDSTTLYDSQLTALRFQVAEVASLANRVAGEKGRVGEFQIHCQWSTLPPTVSD